MLRFVRSTVWCIFLDFFSFLFFVVVVVGGGSFSSLAFFIDFIRILLCFVTAARQRTLCSTVSIIDVLIVINRLFSLSIRLVSAEGGK